MLQALSTRLEVFQRKAGLEKHDAAVSQQPHDAGRFNSDTQDQTPVLCCGVAGLRPRFYIAFKDCLPSISKLFATDSIEGE